MTTHAPKGVPLPFNRSVSYVQFTCEYYASAVTSGGYFRHDNPMSHPVSFFLSQLGAAAILYAILRLLLRPLKQPRFVAEMLAGIMLGPSMFHLLGKGDYIDSLMTNKERNMLGVLEVLGLTTFSFIVGVRTDINILKSAGKMPWIIGVLSFIFPAALVFPAAALLKKYVGEAYGFLLYWVGMMAIRTSFQVVSFLLEDLSILNSELGRLALSSALISSICSWIFTTYHNYFKWAKLMNFRTLDYFKTEIPRAFCVLGIIFGLRPFMYWLMRKIPEGRPIRESHFFVVTVLLFAVSFAYEYLGFSSPLGAMILGLCVPPGPPLGSGVVKKLEVFITAVLLPLYIVSAGRNVNIFQISMGHFIEAEILIVLAFFGKLAAGVIPSLACKMPYKDSFALGLLLSQQGFFDVLTYKWHLRYMVLSEEFYTVLTLMAVVNEALVTPLIYFLYNPSKRYSNYKRRTIQQSRHENELRILLCFQEEDQVCSLMNVLKASYPTREKPIGAFVLELVELLGRENALLINHQFHQRHSTTRTRTDRIINAFNQYELRSEGAIKHQHYTSIAPYVSMHDDICTLAREKSASVLIFPFQKSDNSQIPGVMRNVLGKAPCSVGILVDKKIIVHWTSDSDEKARLSVCVVFAGGPDAREALAYGMRMVANPAIRLTILRLIAEDEFISDMLETRHDIDLIQELRGDYGDDERIEYREEFVKDGVETSKVLLSLDDHYDFMLVGRRIDSDSSLVKGLVDWNHAQELGIIGDMLASSDMKCSASILVLQQQSTVEDLAHAHQD